MGAIIIHEVYEDGAAARDGRLWTGDQILEVRGEGRKGGGRGRGEWCVSLTGSHHHPRGVRGRGGSEGRPAVDRGPDTGGEGGGGRAGDKSRQYISADITR